MPMIPTPVRASLTSSSLHGLMIASTFFTHRPPEAGRREQRACRTSINEIGPFRRATHHHVPLCWAAPERMHTFQALSQRSRSGSGRTGTDQDGGKCESGEEEEAVVRTVAHASA